MPGLEPWLRGLPSTVDPLRSQLLLSLQQAEEDIDYFTEGMSDAQIWAKPHGLASVGYHWTHIIGSVDRLLTYTQGRSLSPEQLAGGAAEMQRTVPRDELLRLLRAQFGIATEIVNGIRPDTYTEERFVGRKKLPTTVGNLLVHIAEHTQRHVGQLIVTAKLLKPRTTSSDVSRR